MELGKAVTARPDFQLLRQILDSDDPLDHEEIARAKRAVADLNTLGSVLTRTRKVDVPDAKAMRVAEQIEVEWTPQERAMYDGIQAALHAGVPRSRHAARFRHADAAATGSLLPARDAGGPAATSTARFRTSYEDEDVDVADEGESPVDAVVDPSLSTLPELLRPLGVDSKFEAMVARLRQAARRGHAPGHDLLVLQGDARLPGGRTLRSASPYAA